MAGVFKEVGVEGDSGLFGLWVDGGVGGRLVVGGWWSWWWVAGGGGSGCLAEYVVPMGVGSEIGGHCSADHSHMPQVYR